MAETTELIVDRDPLQKRLSRFPWWGLALFLIFIWGLVFIYTTPNYKEALDFILPGLKLTVSTALTAYAIALVLGLLAGLGRISGSVVFNNLATLYVELIRGIPMIVLIFFIAYVGIPVFLDSTIVPLSQLLGELGLAGLSRQLGAVNTQSISMNSRAIIALSVTYGAFLAEIFRAGIQSISRGQMEAARSLGMSYRQAMLRVILPQAIRNVLPALGNDFVAMVKDTSLVSVLAVRDITQIARLYAGRSFRFKEGYFTLAVLYLTIVVILSLLVRLLERQLRKDE